MHRFLIIVARDRPDLWQGLVRATGSTTPLDVILDRRTKPRMRPDYERRVSPTARRDPDPLMFVAPTSELIWKLPSPTVARHTHEHALPPRRTVMTADVQMVADWTTQVAQWIDQGGMIVEEMRGIVSECDKSKRDLVSIQQRYEDLQKECEALRTEVHRLTAQVERAQSEHAETAEWFSTVMLEAATRLRGTQLVARAKDVPQTAPDNVPAV